MGNKDSFLPIIKDRVIRMLKLENKTQKEMAKDLDITPEHLSRCLKKGKISKPWLIAIANYLDCSPEWLSNEDAEDSSFFGYERSQAIMNQDEILMQLFLLLGFSERHFQSLSKADKENMKVDIDSVIAYYTMKARERKEKEANDTDNQNE